MIKNKINCSISIAFFSFFFWFLFLMSIDILSQNVNSRKVQLNIECVQTNDTLVFRIKNNSANHVVKVDPIGINYNRVVLIDPNNIETEIYTWVCGEGNENVHKDGNGASGLYSVSPNEEKEWAVPISSLFEYLPF